MITAALKLFACAALLAVRACPVCDGNRDVCTECGGTGTVED